MPAAIHAALATLGWACRRFETLAATEQFDPRPHAIVMIAHPDGSLPGLPVRPGAERAARGPVIAIGGSRSWPAWAEAADRLGLTAALDGDAPFLHLIEALDDALDRPASATDLVGLTEAVRLRAEQVRRCEQLTRREGFVLRELLAGRGAGDIVASEHVSLATVRTQLRAVLTKLEVSSQAAAVALAARTWPDRPVTASLAPVTPS